ncbi:na[+]-dependent inorganic phosphate cotransporter isoform X1 [Megachile rotundata]|uniref:na[+]-dependent inorganic phosphate cotransporter isoform X1 n=1 Tax=Megachile rotundata TaxID=143995 RepID=UPI000258D83A|nr:PREDICTED: sialin [Megachile rotundata]
MERFGKLNKRKEWLSCRDVLWYLVFCGFAANYMMRINLNLAIVAMVIPRPKIAITAQCNPELTLNNQSYNINGTFTTTPSSVSISDNVEYGDRFAWNEYQQGLALGAYYWLHWLSQLPGGLLTRRYGTKLVYGLGNFFSAIFGLFIPFLTRYHLYALVLLRVLQGLSAGVMWPSMHNMTAKWIPPNERSRFVSSYLGSSVGAAITYPLCAAVSSTFGWPAAFYVTSFFGLIWYGFWLCLVYDSPQQHPRITDEERKYILDTIGDSVDEGKPEIPWRNILTSGPVWFTIIAHWGSGWGFLTLMTQTPTYFNFIHGWNINATGVISGVPHLLRMVFSYYFSVMSDWLIRTKRMSLTNVRKLATFVSIGLQGVFILLLGFSGCEPTLAVIFMMAGITVTGAVSAATFANFVDLSPNYASILLGLCGMIVIWSGFISPAVVGILTNNNQTISQWRIVFIIATVNSLIGTVVYLLFGTSKEQPWNRYGKSNKESGQEMQKLTESAIIKSEEINEKMNVNEKDKMIG